jgi:hypothetical protein
MKYEKVSKHKYLDNISLRLIASLVSFLILSYFVLFHQWTIYGDSQNGCCQKALQKSPSNLQSSIPFNRTTCSSKAFLKGDHQKVIAYVYYDDPDNTMTESRKYFYGIEVNALMNKKFYKDWKMWIYHDVDVGSDKNRWSELGKYFITIN